MIFTWVVQFAHVDVLLAVLACGERRWRKLALGFFIVLLEELAIHWLPSTWMTVLANR